MKIHALALITLSTTFASAKKRDTHHDAVMKRLDALEAVTKAQDAEIKAQKAEIKALHAAKAAPQAQGGNLRRRQLADGLEDEPESIVGYASLAKTVAGLQKCVQYDPYFFKNSDACIFGSDYIDYSVVLAADDIKLNADADYAGSGDVLIKGDSVDVDAADNVSIEADNDINIVADEYGDGEVNIEAPSSVDIHADESIDIVADHDGYGTSESLDLIINTSGDGEIDIEAPSSVDIDADESIDIVADADGYGTSESLDLRVDSGGDGEVNIEAPSSIDIDASESLDINAQAVQIDSDGYGYGDGIVLNSNTAIDLYASSGDITIGASDGNVEIGASGAANVNSLVTVTPPPPVVDTIGLGGMSMSNTEDPEDISSVDSVSADEAE